jgi:hypothetical protein
VKCGTGILLNGGKVLSWVLSDPNPRGPGGQKWGGVPLQPQPSDLVKTLLNKSCRAPLFKHGQITILVKMVGYNNSNFYLKKYVLDRPEMGATTFSITALSIITLGIKTLRIECNLNVVRLSVAIY